MSTNFPRSCIQVWVIGSALAAGVLIGAELPVPARFASIQLAIDAAKPGDTVVVEAGRYQERIRVAQGVTVRSAGDATAGERGLARAEATVLDAGGKAPAVVLEEGASLDGFLVTGAGQFDQATFDKHHAERGENLPDTMGAVGVRGGSAAILVGDASAKVSDCIVRDNGHPGIGVSGGGNRSEILNNLVYRNMGGGIGIADGARARVAGNRCWENLRAGIGCRNASPLIENNQCFENVRAGIGIREGATPRVIGNECYRNRRAGIGVRMPGTEPVIEGNHCHDNGMAGIGCRDRAAPFILENNCSDNRLAGIGATGNARPVIVGNKIEGNEEAAIGLDVCESGVALIRDNEIRPSRLVGIGVHRGWTVRVAGNRVSREGGLPPLVMVFEGAKAEFVENTFVGSGVAAIRSQGQIFVSGNTFECPQPRKGGPPQQAVWALPGSMLSMTDDNVVRGWRAPENPAIRVNNRAELEAALRGAEPGSTILLAAGDYAGGLSVPNLSGAEGRPIVIAGGLRQEPPVFKGGNSGLHLVGLKHVELRQMIIEGASGNGLNIDDGGKAETPARGLVLSELVVRDIGGKGNRDGIKLSGVDGFRIENCRIERWGTGGSGIDMVGCHDGVISDSRFAHGQDAMGANGVQAKGGSSGIVVRRCRFEDAGGRGVNLGGSTGIDYFRPRDAVAEAREIVVEDCVFRGSMAPVAFVGVEGGVVRHNTIHRPARWVVRILQENTMDRFVRCREGRFERNLVEFRSDELRAAVNIGAHTEPESFRFRENVWICLDRPGMSQRLIELPVQEAGGIHDPSIREREEREEGLGSRVVSGGGVRWAGGD